MKEIIEMSTRFLLIELVVLIVGWLLRSDILMVFASGMIMITFLVHAVANNMDSEEEKQWEE